MLQRRVRDEVPALAPSEYDDGSFRSYRSVESYQEDEPSYSYREAFGSVRESVADDRVGRFAEGEFVVYDAKGHVGLLLKLLLAKHSSDKDRARIISQEGKPTWVLEASLTSVFGTPESPPKDELQVGDWLRRPYEDEEDGFQVGQALEVVHLGRRVRVRWEDGSDEWCSSLELTPPSADAPRTAVVIADDGSILPPEHVAAAEESDKQKAAAEELKDAHRARMLQLRGVMSKSLDDEDASDDEGGGFQTVKFSTRGSVETVFGPGSSVALNLFDNVAPPPPPDMPPPPSDWLERRKSRLRRSSSSRSPSSRSLGGAQGGAQGSARWAASDLVEDSAPHELSGSDEEYEDAEDEAGERGAASAPNPLGSFSAQRRATSSGAPLQLRSMGPLSELDPEQAESSLSFHGFVSHRQSGEIVVPRNARVSFVYNPEPPAPTAEANRSNGLHTSGRQRAGGSSASSSRTERSQRSDVKGESGGGLFGFLGGLFSAMGQSRSGLSGRNKPPTSSDGSSPFGRPLFECELSTSYNCRVPTIAKCLWKAIVCSTSTGVRTEGLFRLTPDASTVLAAERELLSKGYLGTAHAPEAIAHLLKSFFRRLPPPGLLGGVPIETIAACNCAEGCTALLGALSPLEQELLEWLVRVLLEVHEQRDANKMKLKNLTVVFAPNLWLVDPATLRKAHSKPEDAWKDVEYVEQALFKLCELACKGGVE